VGKKPKAS